MSSDQTRPEEIPNGLAGSLCASPVTAGHVTVAPRAHRVPRPTGESQPNTRQELRAPACFRVIPTHPRLRDCAGQLPSSPALPRPSLDVPQPIPKPPPPHPPHPTAGAAPFHLHPLSTSGSPHHPARMSGRGGQPAGRCAGAATWGGGWGGGRIRILAARAAAAGSGVKGSAARASRALHHADVPAGRKPGGGPARNHSRYSSPAWSDRPYVGRCRGARTAAGRGEGRWTGPPTSAARDAASQPASRRACTQGRGRGKGGHPPCRPWWWARRRPLPRLPRRRLGGVSADSLLEMTPAAGPPRNGRRPRLRALRGPGRRRCDTPPTHLKHTGRGGGPWRTKRKRSSCVAVGRDGPGMPPLPTSGTLPQCRLSLACTQRARHHGTEFLHIIAWKIRAAAN